MKGIGPAAAAAGVGDGGGVEVGSGTAGAVGEGAEASPRTWAAPPECKNYQCKQLETATAQIQQLGSLQKELLEKARG